VWSTVNDVVSDFAAAPDGGYYGVVATYDGDLWLAEGEFR
jgi:hypothetical protein